VETSKDNSTARGGLATFKGSSEF